MSPILEFMIAYILPVIVLFIFFFGLYDKFLA